MMLLMQKLQRQTEEVVETQESIEVAKTPDVAEVTKTRESFFVQNL